LVGLNIIQLSFNEMISGGDGFAFDYAAIAPTPLPPTLPLFATGLAGLGLLGWRRKKKTAATTERAVAHLPDKQIEHALALV
jgi:hypothetical protein